ncbi:MAG: serine hydrolase [Planctomycetota bacterium]|jgi:CubicO group peptidase (beta-lactamase class C family)
MKTKIFIIIYVGLFTFLCEGKDIRKIDQIDSVMKFYAKYYDFNGAILVAENGKIIYKDGFGYANYEWNLPNSVNTKFRIASITKGFTAILFLQLLEEGKVNINDKLIKYIPEVGSKIGDKVTIKHLLIHQSGIRDVDVDLSSKQTKIDFVKELQKSELLFKPGTKEKYCNFNYFLLAVIVERISEKPLYLVLADRILKPLNMQNTGVDNGEKMIQNLAVANYVNQINQAEKSYHVPMWSYGPNAFGLGNMYSTVEDLYKWVQAYFSSRLIKEKTKQLFTDNENLIYDTPVGGFTRAIKIKGKERLMATGDGGGQGFRSFFLHLTEDNHTIIMLCNTHYFGTTYNGTPFYDQIPFTIARILYGDKFDLPKIPISKYLTERFEKGKTIDELLKEYNDNKSKENQYLIDVKQLNKVGNYFLEKNELEKAFQFLKLNLQEYPESWIVYDGMGEHYYRSGRSNKAIEYFKISLEKNPNKWREQRKLYRLRKEIIEVIGK